MIVQRIEEMKRERYKFIVVSQDYVCFLDGESPGPKVGQRTTV